MLLLLQIRHRKVFTIFGIDVSCLSYRYILFSVIGPRFPDYSSFARVKGGRIPSWPDPLGVPWVHGLGTKEVGHHVLVKSHDPGREDPALRTQ